MNNKFLCCCLFILFSGQLYSQSTSSLDKLQQANDFSKVDVSNFHQLESGPSKRSNSYSGVINSANSNEIDQSPLPYGSNLFLSDFATQRSDGLNASYIVAPGDKISVQLWGAVSYSEVLTVDNQGNIFIAEIGPITISGTPATQVNNVVTSKIKSIYTNNVNVYVNLLSTTPVSVYVTGPVIKPGQYAGLASDSVLFFLAQAGGIDANKGSYRKVQILRNNNLLQTYDLYEFLREGKLEGISFKDGDVILVAEQGPVVSVEGAVRYPLRFELLEQHSAGKSLMYYARPLAKVTHVGVMGDRADGSVVEYLPISEFASFSIGDGDVVTFNDDLVPDVIRINLSGSFIGPSIYTFSNDTRLVTLLDHVEVDPTQADVNSIYIKRKSVAKQQKELLEDSLRRLERSIFTAPASSDGEARIRAQEAELVMQFVDRARKIRPLGKVVLAENGNIANIRLEQDDEIVIPLKTDLVQVSGEVLMPQAIVFNPSAKVQDYIAWAGGFSARAETEKIALVHANGLLTFVDDKSDEIVKPGDKILILPKVDTKTLQAIKDITQIIYQIAVAANVAL